MRRVDVVVRSMENPGEAMSNDLNPLNEAIMEAAEDENRLNSASDPFASQAVAEPEGKPDKKKREKKKKEKPAKAAKPPKAAKKPKSPGGSKLTSASPYTVLLAVAMIAIVAGILLATLELANYGFALKPN